MKYLILISALLLVGCNSEDDPAAERIKQDKRIIHHTLSDGTRCIIWGVKGGFHGGISCDWQGAKEAVNE